MDTTYISARFFDGDKVGVLAGQLGDLAGGEVGFVGDGVIVDDAGKITAVMWAFISRQSVA